MPALLDKGRIIVGMLEPAARPDRIAILAHDLAIGALAGVVAGVAAGVAARVAMRLFIVGIGGSPDFTLAGTAAILFFGVVFGTGAGAFYAMIRRWLPGPWPIRGLLFGALLIATLELPTLIVEPAEAGPNPPLGMALFAGVALAFGIVAAAIAPVVERRIGRVGRQGPVIGLSAIVGIISLCLLAFAAAGFYVEVVRGLIG